MEGVVGVSQSVVLTNLTAQRKSKVGRGGGGGERISDALKDHYQAARPSLTAGFLLISPRSTTSPSSAETRGGAEDFFPPARCPADLLNERANK